MNGGMELGMGSGRRPGAGDWEGFHGSHWVFEAGTEAQQSPAAGRCWGTEIDNATRQQERFFIYFYLSTPASLSGGF